MNEDGTTREHLSAEEVAAYIDGTIAEAERERVEAHAAACAECRNEIAEVAATLRRHHAAKKWRVVVPVAAAAAAVALLIVNPFSLETGPERTGRFRGPEVTADREGAVEIRVLEPPTDSAVRTMGVAFAWHAGGVGASYQLTVTNDEGGVVWSFATTDTVASLPDTIELEPGATYYWYVDGLLEDGQHATSGVRSFITQR